MRVQLTTALAFRWISAPSRRMLACVTLLRRNLLPQHHSVKLKYTRSSQEIRIVVTLFRGLLCDVRRARLTCVDCRPLLSGMLCTGTQDGRSLRPPKVVVWPEVSLRPRARCSGREHGAEEEEGGRLGRCAAPPYCDRPSPSPDVFSDISGHFRELLGRSRELENV